MKWLVKREEIAVVEALTEKEALTFTAEHSFNVVTLMVQQKAFMLDRIIEGLDSMIMEAEEKK
jgi:hypothetical protein